MGGFQQFFLNAHFPFAADQTWKDHIYFLRFLTFDLRSGSVTGDNFLR